MSCVPRRGDVLAERLGKRLVRPLHDALRADVDPRARGHLAIHHEALAVELLEMLPRGPVRHEVGVGDQHARRIGVRAQHRDGLARLHEQRFVVAQALQRREDGVEAFPVARGAPDAAVDHQLGRVLGDVRIEVVLDHAERRLGEPAAARELRAARGAHDAARVAMVGSRGLADGAVGHGAFHLESTGILCRAA